MIIDNVYIYWGVTCVPHQEMFTVSLSFCFFRKKSYLILTLLLLQIKPNKAIRDGQPFTIEYDIEQIHILHSLTELWSPNRILFGCCMIPNSFS